jgi:hypothetical protein
MRIRRSHRRATPLLLAALAGVGAAVAAVAAPSASAAVLRSAKVSSFTATPDTLSWKGGSVRLSGHTSGASFCTFSSKPAITGLPDTIPCPGGSPGIWIKVGKDLGNGENNWALTLKAVAGDGSSQSVTIEMHQTPQPPVVTNVSLTPSHLPDTGGKATFTVDVSRAQLCVLSSNPNLPGLPENVPCSSGKAVAAVMVPATTTGQTLSYDLNLSVAGLGGSGFPATGTLFVQGQPPQVWGFSASPTTIPDTGGTVTLTANVRYGAVCGFGDNWKGGQKNPIPSSSLPKNVSCFSGKVTYKVTVDPNTTTLRDIINFLLKVTSDGGVVKAVNEPGVVLQGKPSS